MSKIRHISIFLITLNILVSQAGFAGTKEAASYYEKALREYNAKNYKKAEIQLKNVIQQDGNYLAAYVLLAKTYLVNGNGAGAEKEIQRAIRQGADKQLTLPILADALLIQNKYSDVLESIPESGLDAKLQSTLLQSRGEAYLEIREYEKSLQAYQKAQSLNPVAEGPYLGLAAVHISELHYEKAETQISRALDININSAQAWQLKASIQHAQGNIAKAFEYYEKSLQSEPYLLSSLLGRASLYFDTNQLDKAFNDLEILTDKYPLEPRISYLKQSVLRAQGNREKADTILINTYNYLDKVPFERLRDHASMLLLAAVVSYESEQFEKALVYLRAYVAKYPREPYSEKLLASVLLSKGEYHEATQLLESVNQRQPDDYHTLTLLGAAYMNIQLYNKANEAFDKAISLRGSSAPARIHKAFNELRFGRFDIAQKELETVFNRALDARSGLMLVTLHMKNSDYSSAEKVAQKVVDNDSENIIARNLLGVSQIELKKYPQARSNFKTILSREAEFFPANMNLVKLDVIEDKLDDAEMRLQILLDKKNNLSTVMLALSKLDQKRKKRESALRWAEKAYDADKKNISAVLHLIYVNLSYGDPKKALRVAEDAVSLYPNDISIKTALGESYFANGFTKRAHSQYKDVSKLASYDTQPLFHVARLQFESGDVEEAVWSLHKAVEGDPSFMPARQALIEAQISLGRLENAKKQLDLFKAYNANVLYLRLQGDWYSASKEYSKAINNYEKVMNENPGSDTAIRLFKTHAAKGDLKAGVSVLENWLSKETHNIRVKNLLAEAYMSQKEHKKAIKLFDEVITELPGHASALNNLAVIYQQQDDLNRALDLARRAQQLAPNSPAFNDTLGWILTESGKPQEGILYLRNAHARVSQNTEIRYHIAVSLEKLGRREEAKTELKSLLDGEIAEFPSKQAAADLYKTISQ